MEKVLVNCTGERPKEIIVIYDSGSGRTVGNNIELLDQSKERQFTNLIISSLNGIDTSRKRVCELNIYQNIPGSCSFQVIVPRDKIPPLKPQSMSMFKEKLPCNRYKETWISDITEYDLKTLPLVLLGLTDIKHFPVPIDKRYIRKNLVNKFPHLQFYYSKLTGRRMAAGITGDSIKDGIINNIMYDYQEIPNETYQFKDHEIQVNYNVEQNYRNYNLEI